jgi:hypothetical protein
MDSRPSTSHADGTDVDDSGLGLSLMEEDDSKPVGNPLGLPSSVDFSTLPDVTAM